MGGFQACEACTISKAKQKNVPKITKTKLLKEGENRIFLDIVTVKRTKNYGMLPNRIGESWLMEEVD